MLGAARGHQRASSIPILVSDLEALRLGLGLGRIVPLGFSFGGELAMEYGLQHPERVEKLFCSPARRGIESASM